jgi:Transglutaminase-like superfamily
MLPALARLVPLRSLVRRLWREQARELQERRAERVLALARAIYGRRRPLRNNCLFRSLLTYRFLAEANADPRLVVGVRRGGSGIDGHVWVMLRERPVHESSASLAEFRPVLIFGPLGRAEPLEELPPSE